MIIFIENNVPYHNELIESVILHYDKIITNVSFDKTNVSIFLSINHKCSYCEYITNKYPTLSLAVPKTFDYRINVTIYDRDYNTLINSNKYFYISHDVTDRLQNHPNVLFLTPLGNPHLIADSLPFTENKRVSNIPIYIIQGNITSSRRYYKLLQKILEHKYEYDFIVKLVGSGEKLPEELQQYSNKIILKNNLDFINYHKEFLDAYCILPLITKKTHPQYYKYKLTSSINYCTGYKLKCLLDKDLQHIYNLNNVEIFTDENDIADSFKKTLIDFYATPDRT